VLGLPWDLERDTIKFSFGKLIDKALVMQPTKRNLLSLLASVFDPLGITSLMIVSMKMLYQYTSLACMQIAHFKPCDVNMIFSGELFLYISENYSFILKGLILQRTPCLHHMI